VSFFVAVSSCSVWYLGRGLERGKEGRGGGESGMGGRCGEGEKGGFKKGERGGGERGGKGDMERDSRLIGKQDKPPKNEDRP